MNRSKRCERSRRAGVMLAGALGATVALSSASIAQLGGGGAQPPRPAEPAAPAQPRPVTQDGVRVAPQSAPTDGQQVRRMIPPLKASPEKVEMGVIRPHGKKTGTITLTNTGAETINIARVNSSCSCTVAELPKRTLAPGESVELTATLDAGEFIGSMQRTVRVYVEGYAPPFEVWVTADVAYDIKADPVFVGAFQSDTGEVRVTEINGKPFNILSVNGAPAVFKDFDAAKDSPKSEYSLVWNIRGVDSKDLPLWWVVETDHPDAPVVDLRVLHPAIMPRPDPRRAWQLGADRSMLGYVTPGQPSTFTINVKERRRSEDEPGMPTVSGKSEHLKFSLVKSERTDEGYAFEVTVVGTLPANGSTLINEPVTIKWRDTEETYWVFGRLAMRPDPRAAR